MYHLRAELMLSLVFLHTEVIPEHFHLLLYWEEISEYFVQSSVAVNQERSM
jgi:hypothetical protein